MPRVLIMTAYSIYYCGLSPHADYTPFCDDEVPLKMADNDTNYIGLTNRSKWKKLLVRK
jgi:hypothetical protein